MPEHLHTSTSRVSVCLLAVAGCAQPGPDPVPTSTTEQDTEEATPERPTPSSALCDARLEGYRPDDGERLRAGS